MASIHEQLEKFSASELRSIILDLAARYPPTRDVIDEHEKTRSRQSGVCVTLEYDTFYIAMSEKEYDFLCDNYDGVDLGACCGQSRCYVCKAYGHVHVGTSDMEFLEDISDEQMNIDSNIKEEVEDDIFEFLKKHRDEIDK